MKTVLLSAMGAAVVAAALTAAPAQAAPGFTLPGAGTCNYPGTSGGVDIMGVGVHFCDYPPVLAGMHYHCEWGGFLGSGGGNCTWRNADNTMAPPPPAEQIFW